VSTTAAAAAALATLAGAGALPTVALVGLRWPTWVLAPLAGAVMAAAAVMAELALGGSLLPWFAGLAAAGALASVAWWWWQPARRPWRDPGRGTHRAGLDRWPSWLGGLAGALGIAAAVAWSLRPLRTPRFGFDARAIYLLHAGWYADGHRAALLAARNPALLFSQQTYPPLTSAATAVSWLVTGTRTDRLGVVVVACLNACAVAAAAWAVVEVGRTVAGSGPTRCPWRALPLVVGPLAAGLVALAAFGIAGPYATNGYTDLLWSAAAVGAVGFGLVLSGRRADLGAAAILLAVAGLTKDEAIPTAMVVVVLLGLRDLWRRRTAERGREWWPPVVGAGAGVLALAIWPLLARALGFTRVGGGTRPGAFGTRVHQTWSAAVPHLHPVAVALVVSVVGALVLRRVRRRAGLGNDLWAWAVVAAYLGALGTAYVRTIGSLPFRLVTSIDRTTTFPALAGWFIVAVWAVVGTGAPLATGPPPPEEPRGEPREEPAEQPANRGAVPETAVPQASVGVEPVSPAGAPDAQRPM
jgi:hypothetical protein